MISRRGRNPVASLTTNKSLISLGDFEQALVFGKLRFVQCPSEEAAPRPSGGGEVQAPTDPEDHPKSFS